MITSRSYFVTDIQISNAQDTAPNSSLIGNGVNLDLFISDYERDVLIKCLGYSLYKEFQSNLEVKAESTLQTVKESSDQKWKDLLNGKNYTINGIDVIWKGLIFKEGNLDKSLIANYVFCKYVKSDFYASQYETEKTKFRNPSLKYVESWNAFQELAVSGNNGERSLYQFINDMNALNTGTYLNFTPTDFRKINQFSL